MTEKDNGREKIEIGKRIISFIGPEGSGKTTIANLLCQDSGKPYLTTGNILRDLAANDPGYYGEQAREMFANHAYLDGKLLLEIMCNRFSQEDTRNGFVLDGGFRTVEETRDLEETLKQAGRNFPVTLVYLNIPTQVSFERLITGDNARKRGDDTPEALQCRLDKFNYQLRERLDIVKSNPNWNIVEIDATGPVEEVYRKVCDSVVNTSRLRS